jgi:5'-3' exonuclease
VVRVHLVDGTYELFRAHFAPRPAPRLRTNRDLKATVGVVGSLLALLDDAHEDVTHLGVAFDNPIRSFRNDLYPGYKDETGMDADVLAQLDDVERAVRALGVVVWSMDRWEADDALATAATTLADAVTQVRILTPDKDLGQVVSGTRVVQVDRARGREIDEEGVIARLGVPPTSVPDLLALVGDTADGIPGLPGFGAVTAGTLLRRYEHVDEIPDDHHDWDVEVRGAARLAATLHDRREDALLYRRLATLDLAVPIDTDLAALEHAGVPREAFTAWCDEIGADRLRDRPRRWASRDRPTIDTH